MIRACPKGKDMKRMEALSGGEKSLAALAFVFSFQTFRPAPFYIFDEWASDQDPLFKEVFYTQLLPELKARNKTVLVITHDDRYFHLADRIVKLDYGRIETENRAAEPAASCRGSSRRRSASAR